MNCVYGGKSAVHGMRYAVNEVEMPENGPTSFLAELADAELHHLARRTRPMKGSLPNQLKRGGHMGLRDGIAGRERLER